VRQAFVAAVHLLPPRRRAILILRDVLDWSAADLAEMLDTTSAAVNSALQRLRARLDEIGVAEEDVDESTDPDRRALVDRYVTAFQRADIAGLTQLLTDDVVLEMLPFLNWYVGRPAYRRFIARVFTARGGDWRMLPTGANGQPAAAACVRGQDGEYHAHTLQVLTVTGSGISRNTTFGDPDLFSMFDLPAHLIIEA
jgi:RNA polymerase sigma-70 factor, ECF subfamily